jgi:hypothetical protein
MYVQPLSMVLRANHTTSRRQASSHASTFQLISTFASSPHGTSFVEHMCFRAREVDDVRARLERLAHRRQLTAPRRTWLMKFRNIASTSGPQMLEEEDS